jgi:hypothetical protein
MTPLLYFMAFGWMLVLFTSTVGLIIWILVKVYKGLTEPPDPTKQIPKGRKAWNPNQLKRAGQ